MAGEANSTAAGAGGGAPAGSGESANNTNTAGGGNPSGAAGAPAGAGGLNREALNPMLRGMNEEQINEVFDTLFTAARNTGPSGVPEHARQQEETPRPISKEDLREYFDPTSEKFDPQAAIDRVVATNYGSLIGDINRRSLSGVEVALRQQFNDYDKYKADIDLILKDRPPATITQQDMLGAYYMAKGARTTEAEIRERQKPPTTAAPSPVNEGPAKDPADELTPTELDVARIMFPGNADPAAEFKRVRARAAAGVTKVPGDK